MASQGDRKRKQLEQAGLLNRHPDLVQDELFHQHYEFFDSQDLLQVRYEMLRSHTVDQRDVADVCKRYGVSRQTYYTLQGRFEQFGSAGLLARRPGPRGPSKLKGAALKYVCKALDRDPRASTAEIIQELKARFGIAIHRRTIEKLVWERDIKKNSTARPQNRRS